MRCHPSMFASVIQIIVIMVVVLLLETFTKHNWPLLSSLSLCGHFEARDANSIPT